jgi:hypothetical protein
MDAQWSNSYGIGVIPLGIWFLIGRGETRHKYENNYVNTVNNPALH